MANILLIETATDICSVGIWSQDEVVALREISERADHAARINELILKICREAGVALTDLDAVAVSSGPGSFTSLRVGTATAKGMCFGLDIPLIAVDTLSALALATHTPQVPKTLYCPMIDARRMEVYTSFYDGQMRQLVPPHALIITPDSFATYLDAGYRVVLSGNGAEKCLSVLPASIEFSPVYCSAIHLAPLALKAYTEERFADLAYFEPYYLKSPNITKAKKKL